MSVAVGSKGPKVQGSRLKVQGPKVQGPKVACNGCVLGPEAIARADILLNCIDYVMCCSRIERRASRPPRRTLPGDTFGMVAVWRVSCWLLQRQGASPNQNELK